MLKRILIPLLACGALGATESFEAQTVGDVTQLPLEVGELQATAGSARILKGHARSGEKALHLLGGQNRQVSVRFRQPTTELTPVSFWVERWTSRDPFTMTVKAVTPQGEKQLAQVKKLKVGGYHHKVEVVLPVGTTALVIEGTTDAKGGILIDDLDIHSGPMMLESAEMLNPGAWPMLKRARYNPVLGYKVKTRGVENPAKMTQMKLKVSPASAVSKVTLRSGNEQAGALHTADVLGSGVPDKDGNITITCDSKMKPGVSWIWVDAALTEAAEVGSTVSFVSDGVTIDKKVYGAQSAPVVQRIGYLVSEPGETVGNQPNGAAPRPCISFRIPGLIRTMKGSLVGCFDARYVHSGDLCADIDVAVVRSEDGGLTWTKPEVGMDAGPGPKNGCGDPCILQDTSNGRLWMQSLVCHFGGGASLWTSKTGFDPKETGQWEMVYSDDDGKTWSKEHVNPTRSIKKEEWTTILAGPGNGIYTSKGVIVFPAQIWDRAANPRCMSTICYSKDGGKTWVYGTGVPHATSECQVVELQDGAIMINCRNEARQGNRIVYVTRDLGKTWEEHPTNNNTLREPTCQASLISIDSPKYGKLLLFSNPKAGNRSHMTIRVSKDDGKTWSNGYEYDIRGCWGYSSLAPIDDNHIGVFYETSHVGASSNLHGIGFLRIPLDDIMKAQ